MSICPFVRCLHCGRQHASGVLNCDCGEPLLMPHSESGDLTHRVVTYFALSALLQLLLTLFFAGSPAFDAFFLGNAGLGLEDAATLALCIVPILAATVTMLNLRKGVRQWAAFVCIMVPVAIVAEVHYLPQSLYRSLLGPLYYCIIIASWSLCLCCAVCLLRSIGKAGADITGAHGLRIGALLACCFIGCTTLAVVYQNLKYRFTGFHLVLLWFIVFISALLPICYAAALRKCVRSQITPVPVDEASD